MYTDDSSEVSGAWQMQMSGRAWELPRNDIITKQSGKIPRFCITQAKEVTEANAPLIHDVSDHVRRHLSAKSDVD